MPLRTVVPFTGTRALQERQGGGRGEPETGVGYAGHESPARHPGGDVKKVMHLEL